MALRLPQNDWWFITLIGKTVPPRDPDDDDDAEEEDHDDDSNDDCEPAVIREPDE